MYADGTTINFNIEDFDTNNLEAEINKELEQVNTWPKVNKLSLNVGKTKIIATMWVYKKREFNILLLIICDLYYFHIIRCFLVTYSNFR